MTHRKDALASLHIRQEALASHARHCENICAEYRGESHLHRTNGRIFLPPGRATFQTSFWSIDLVF
jgi:hypothetical protein